MSLWYVIYYLAVNKAFAEIQLIGLFAFIILCFIIVNSRIIDSKSKRSCLVEGIVFHTKSVNMAIKFNSDGRFNYSDRLMNQPKSFWGTWKQRGNKIITTYDKSTTGMGIGQ